MTLKLLIIFQKEGLHLSTRVKRFAHQEDSTTYDRLDSLMYQLDSSTNSTANHRKK